ncbi:MAG: metal ABC transporter permease [Phycisphaerales bacterium]
MHTFNLLFSSHAAYVQYAFVAAVAVGVVCSLLSVIVVLKRMAFIGQGVSHAGFGGYGLAVFLGLGTGATDAVIACFCLLTSLGIGYLVRRRKVEPDSAIGIVLVAGMALGVILQNLRIALYNVPWYRQAFGAHYATVSWEQLLFGSLLTVGPAGLWMSLILAAAVILICGLLYKELMYFAFDETAAQVHGIRTAWCYYLLLAILGLVVVVAMKLVGFILVSALLVIPGAAALAVGRRMRGTLLLAVVIGLIGSLGGLTLSIEVGQLSPGASIVAVLFAMFLLSSLAGRVMRN